MLKPPTAFSALRVYAIWDNDVPISMLVFFLEMVPVFTNAVRSSTGLSESRRPYSSTLCAVYHQQVEPYLRVYLNTRCFLHFQRERIGHDVLSVRVPSFYRLMRRRV